MSYTKKIFTLILVSILFLGTNTNYLFASTETNQNLNLIDSYSGSDDWIIINGDLSLDNGGYEDIYTKNVLVTGNIDINGTDFKKNLIVLGNVDVNTINVKGNLYVYGSIDGNTIETGKWYATDEEDDSYVAGKLKVYGNIDLTSNKCIYSYQYGEKKDYGDNECPASNIGGVFQNFDPLLKIETSKDDWLKLKTISKKFDTDFSLVLNSIVSTNNELKKAKAKGLSTKDFELKIQGLQVKGKNLISDLIIDFESFIEPINFDIYMFEITKKLLYGKIGLSYKEKSIEEITNQIKNGTYKFENEESSKDTSVSDNSEVTTTTSSTTNVSTTSTTSTKSTTGLSDKYKKAVDKFISKYKTNEQKTKILNTLVKKIDKLVDGKKVTTKIQLLIDLGDYCKELLSDFDGSSADDFLNSLGGE